MSDTDIGPQKPQPDPRGWLAFDWLPDDLQRSEDSTQDCDITRARGDHWGQWSRPATPTERILLEHLGYALPADLRTRVQFHTEGVRHRSWPQLKDQATQGE
ncbi:MULTISPECIES: hypothetical protein [Mycobacterium]|uniref:Uncharacterized protein n=1 Tax=Mycobacterium kiyosense TaxID=2871094 RepID=A0A9P3Q4S3_9MYCO|nr:MULTISPECIES: hypothetical protein [Mycobacterium]BDB43849.1 hypothetical protein IWGMT90018_42950 [Mycobacterium kiyosense]BDE15406.1 hypothetical protein MKCMC460_42660 [Mycobacterium sp. 20KCMC460]GLB82706.1 hypothetical protein SRL2020028_19620 [Mycobacterium kiyosense]GLB90169.1 hypothetical protein SRL2020130_29860 [Mycobacterium kiyosense]GLB95758.1 hypothetical protein SRL2020226_25340 [Mycobacterium kiyosense]